ncbi:MAG: carboxypeptidase regulatory-like domain-containing protein [Candidatus Acidiferrales bacterium]
MRAWILWLCCVAALVGMQVVGATPRQDKRGAQPASGAAATTAKSQPQSENRPAATDETAATKLPVRRVVLYKGGVGYFEHLGEVHGDQNMRIDFTSSQLNDVLQSLTVLDLNGGRITGIDYDSEAPFSQRLGTIGLPLGEETDLSKFLAALRGTRLEIRNGNSTITGRLLSVETKSRVTGSTSQQVDLATLVSDSGEVRTVEVTPTVSVRVADADVNREVGRYLTLLASTHQQDLRRMTISAAGSGARQLYVSYISEVPIWKTTYRIVLPSKADDKPLLQGWAIVDNTTGEDWDNVELSLVAGAPQSFIQQLSQPYYARRPVVPLPETAELTPQTHESAMLGGSGSLSGVVTDAEGAAIPNAQVQIVNTATGVANSTTTDDEGNYEFDDLPAGNYRLQINKSGFQTSVTQGVSIGGGGEQTQDAKLQVGSVSQTVEVTDEASRLELYSKLQSPKMGVAGSGRELGNGRGVGAGRGYGIGGPPMAGFAGGVPGNNALTMLRNQASAGAEGANLGDLFEYKLKDHVTIHKNESALVPIVQVHIAAEKVSLWNNSLGSPRPLRALWLTNSSPLTLDGGSFTVLEDEAFAGEGLTDPIKPDEKRLVSYAADLGVRVDAKSESRPQRVTRVRIWRGVMSMTREMQQSTTYTVRDDDTTPRTVLIEHPLRVGWKLAEGTPKPEETTSNVYRFRVSVKPKETSKLEVGESEPLDTRYEISNVTDDQITFFLNQKSINTEVEAALRKIVEQKNRVAALDAEISRRNNEKQKIYDDQQRIRENLKALKGSPEERALTQRYTQQLADQETRLEALQKETQDFQTKRDQAQDELDKMIQSLSLDVRL